MYAYAMPRQYSMLVTAPYVVIPLFKGAGIWGARAVNGLNSFASIWCVVENILLAATAEGLACSMRIPVGEEGKQVMSVLDVPEGYVMPCYIGIGYPAENAHVVAQVEKTVDSALHFGKWQDDFETESCFTYYKSKKELRITKFGRGFPFLNINQTGSLFVFTKQEEEHYSGYFLDTEEEIEEFLNAFGLSLIHISEPTRP